MRFPGRGKKTVGLDIGSGLIKLVVIDHSSMYFNDPDGARIELISDPLGEMYGNPVG